MGGGGGTERVSPRRATLFSNVALACRTGLSHLESYGEEMVRANFRTDLRTHHLDWRHIRYDWLVAKDQVRTTVLK